MTTLSRGSHEETRCWDAPDVVGSGRKRKPTNLGPKSTARGRVEELTRTIEAEIIPRLLLINSTTSHFGGGEHAAAPIDQAIIDEVATVVVRKDFAKAMALIDELQAEGLSLSSIFLELLPPVARQLGQAWDDDKLDFVEVTVGLSRLQQILRTLSPSFENLREASDHGCRVLLMAASGEQHSLGLFTVEVFFRRAGWDVVCAAGLPLQGVIEVIRRDWVDVIGVSKSCDDLLDGLASDITSMRRASRNKKLTVLVGAGYSTDTLNGSR